MINLPDDNRASTLILIVAVIFLMLFYVIIDPNPESNIVLKIFIPVVATAKSNALVGFGVSIAILVIIALIRHGYLQVDIQNPATIIGPIVVIFALFILSTTITTVFITPATTSVMINEYTMKWLNGDYIGMSLFVIRYSFEFLFIFGLWLAPIVFSYFV